MKHILTSILLLVTSWMGVRADVQVVADSLWIELAEATIPGDSLAIMTNLYDVLPRAKSTQLGQQIYGVAQRANDPVTALDILRNQANRYMRSDSMLKVLRQQALEWPESNDREETITFIQMMENIRRGRYGDKSEREIFLTELLSEFGDTDIDNLHHRIALLHGVCMLLSNDSNSELLSVYMDSLGSLVRQLPPAAYSIRNAYNVHAASAYSEIDPEKSIEADKRILRDVERLERYYREKGRIYRSYDATYYTIYSRLLANFAELAPEQVEDYYAKAIQYRDSDPATMKTFERFPAAEIYYALYHKDYAKAASLIGKSEIPPHRTRSMMRWLLACADAIGDQNLALDALRRYATALEDELDHRTRGTYRELQIAYAIYEMKHQIGQMEKERAEGLADMQRGIIISSAIALGILIILVMLLFAKSRSNRELALSLARSNEQLKAESESLRISREESVRARNQAVKANNLKSDFIKNMSYEVKVPLQAITEYSRLIADCAGTTGIKHISRFADMLELNAELLSTIVGDVLRLSDMEAAPIPLHPQVVNLRSLSTATLTAIRHRVAPGVNLTLDPEVSDVDIFTDPLRVQQILNNLLTNAAKFTHKGSIVLSFRECPGSDSVEISVTDTGIGINRDNSEKIFERFVKLDRDSQGAGLGLTIARIIARRLGGDLRLDTTFVGPGSRFILTIPKK